MMPRPLRFFFHLFAPDACGDEFSVFAVIADGGRHIEGIGDGTGETPAYDVGGIHDEEESVGVYFFDQVTDSGDLGEVYDGEDDFLFGSGESALTIEEGGSVTDISKEGIRYFQRFIGDDEGCFSLGKADDDAVCQIGIDVHGNECADGRFQGKEEGSGSYDDDVDTKDDVSYFQIVEFLEDCADYVKSAGIGVVSIEESHGKAQYDTAGNGGNQGIFHDLIIGHKTGEIDEYRAEDGAQNGNQGVQFSHVFQGEDEDRDIENEVGDTDGETGHVVQNHGDTGEASREELVGNQKGIDAYGIAEGADNGDDHDKSEPLPVGGSMRVGSQHVFHKIVLSWNVFVQNEIVYLSYTELFNLQ